MKTDAEIRAKWKEVWDRPRKNPHVIDTGAFVIEVVRWAESGLTQRALDTCPACRGERYVKIGMYHEVCEICHGTGKRQ